MRLNDKEFLRFNLCFVYRMIVASAPLLRFAIPKTQGPLRRYYEHHLKEELGHDKMLKDDLARLGVMVIPRYFEVAEVTGAQYYLIAHDHPAALLGYMHVLERNAAGPEVVDALEKAHGVELKAMRHHAEHDPQHVKELEQQIQQLPNELQALVRWNASNVTRALRRALKVE